MNLFFGDSLTAGENNNDTSFVDYVKGNSLNLGISGTTIGEYSIYPVDGNSLLGVINKYQNAIKNADKIFLEYGGNDVAAIMCGFATVQTVVVSLVKALDWIKQLNPQSKVYFLALGDKKTVYEFALNNSHYLEHEYFSKFDFKFPPSIYSKIYDEILDKISKICDIIFMFKSDEFSDELLSDDNLHPNDEGHKIIAKNINAKIGE